MTFAELAETVARRDGVAAFNEATRLAMAEGRDPRALVTRTDDDGLVALGVAWDEGTAELAVHPDHRRAGLGRGVLDDLLASGVERFWAHGDLPAARGLAATAGLSAVRTLLVLRLELDQAPAPERVPAGVTLRTFRPDDVDAVVAVNARAFAAHPEQGAMDRADFERRAASDWFDPAGLFVAERDGEVVGFHWTKVEDGVGEVYVVGVDPDHHGGGLGTALTARGLRHLWEQGVRVVDLYVEGDNAPALAVYHRLGFTTHAKDVLYSR